MATNAILSKTNAAISDSAIVSAGGVDLDATGTTVITAKILTAAVGVGVGFAGVGASIGVSIARNLIGSTPSGVVSRAEVQATIARSSVTAGGPLTLDAVSNQTIDALVVAGSVAVAGGLYGFSAAGAGATTENRIAADVKATIDGDGATGIRATAIGLSARDRSTVTANTASVAVAASIAPVGAAISIAVALGHEHDRQRHRGVDRQRRHPGHGDHGRDHARRLRDGHDHRLHRRGRAGDLDHRLLQRRRRAGDEHDDDQDEGGDHELDARRGRHGRRAHRRRPLGDQRHGCPSSPPRSA